MWKSRYSRQIDLLKKTQENLEATQRNNQMLSTVFESFMALSENEDAKTARSDEEKLKAAYALNLCTVSISQIIDYNDLQFMEKEYDAILNNLNLEEMPKDEALLSILKRILDVITFFRLQDGDRKLLEKEYQKKVKDAIWSAIPNPTMIVAGGTPVGIAVALATQVGIGYMNYRKERSQIDLEKERSDWELQRSALEQFHGLRRELFDTAWRLADEYNFPDEYRITERQISQYNNILLDQDDIRRYERLEYISNCFKAYPPFWYHLGNAASSVYQDHRLPMDIRNEYRENAIRNFEEFFKITEHNLMREDQLVASCALEMFDLLDMIPENKEEQIKLKEKRIMLLDKAKKFSGNAFDVLQICAVSYLKIGEIKEACTLLNMLINENYNVKMNAQLLSRLYVSNVIEGDRSYEKKYTILASRLERTVCLFPMPTDMPTTEEEKKNLTNEFIYLQKKQLQNNYANVLKAYISKCESKYEAMCKEKIDITSTMANFIKNMNGDINILIDENGSIIFLQEIKNKLPDSFKDMLSSSSKRSQGCYKTTFKSIFESAFEKIADEVFFKIQDISDMSEVSIMDSCLYEFAVKNDINQDKYDYISEDEIGNINFIEEIFGNDFRVKEEENKQINVFIDNMDKQGFSAETLTKNKKKLDFLVRKTLDFESYLKRNRKTINKIPLKDRKIIAILNDKTPDDTDLIFTLNKVYVTGWTRIKDFVPYNEIEPTGKDNKLKIGTHSYGYKDANMGKLKELIELFAEVANSFVDNSESLGAEIKNKILSKEINYKNILANSIDLLGQNDNDA